MDLVQLLEPIRAEMAAVERELSALADRIALSDGGGRSGQGMLESIARHPFAVPGKRLRPALVLLSSRGAGEDGRSFADGVADGASDGAASIALAAAVEVLHSASLVHDDIIDGAAERRHQQSLNQRFGNRIAVLAGDMLYTEFFELLTRLPVSGDTRARILSLFIGTTRKMCVGEIIAQEAEAAGRRLGFEEYEELCYDKTASLFAACCEGGALVRGAGAQRAAAFGEFGRLFGMAFQMADDLADKDHLLDPSEQLSAQVEEYGRLAGESAQALGLFPLAEAMPRLLGYLSAKGGR